MFAAETNLGGRACAYTQLATSCFLEALPQYACTSATILNGVRMRSPLTCNCYQQARPAKLSPGGGSVNWPGGAGKLACVGERHDPKAAH